MPKFAANLSWLFTENDFPERFKLASDARFFGAECLFPYDYNALEVASVLEDFNLEMVLINAPPGEWDKGERGLAGVPGRQAAFRDSINRALEYALTINCRRIHVMAGCMSGEESRESCIDTLKENLAFAAGLLGKNGLVALLEPINGIDMPGYLVTKPDEAAEIITAVGSPHLGLQFDIYHCRKNGIDPLESIRKHQGLIRHFQIAGLPGRNEPEATDPTLPLIDRMLPDVWVGCEYRPAGDTLSGLTWLSDRI